jgi:AcrR family transcriptional regulator
VPRVSQDQLDARRQEILGAARACFARHGYEGATVRRLEEATRLSRGAIFHHFRDKDSLFLAVAEDDAAAMVETVARNGLVQVMRDLLAPPRHHRLAGRQLEVSPVADHPAFAALGCIAASRSETATAPAEAGVLREDVPIDVLAQFLELAYDGLVLHLAMGRPAGDLGPVLDLVEEAVRRR